MKSIFLIFFVTFSLFTVAQTTEEKTLITTTGELKGTLYLPKKAHKLSLLIIQAGSGATDRNGNSLPFIKANCYKLIAQGLAEKGIATLLTDKRGIAASAKAMKAESDLQFEDYANDLADWVKIAKNDKRFKKIFLAGHSEGSLVAMLAAQRETVNGYISIAGAGESINKIIVWQYQQQFPKTALVVDSLFERLKNNLTLDTVPKLLMSIFRPSLQRYISSWMKYDPAIEIAKLTVPVLIMQGTTDLQVTIEQSEYLKNAKPKSKYVLIEEMNHILKLAPKNREKNIATYNQENLPLHSDVVKIICSFIKHKK